MTSNRNIEAFWQDYLDTLPVDSLKPQTLPEAWYFGDSAKMAVELGELVQQGIKIATCSLLWEYEYDGDPIPRADELSIIIDYDWNPLCIIETTEVEIKPYNEVDAQFAYDEGEGDRSLQYWRDAHWRFFSRSCQRIGREISETMPLICERFRVIYPLSQ